MIKNLENREFGRLKVLRNVGKGHWECQCSCGTVITVRGFELTSGNKRSCGCLYKEARIKIGQKSFKDLTNQRFGHLQVQKRVQNIGKYTAYECKCDCGNITVVKAAFLKAGDTKSCGHCNEIPVNVGDKFGSWTVDYLLQKNNRKYAHVTCICGKSKDIVLYNLKKLKNASQECHCSRKGINLHDLTNEHFGNLEVIEYAGMGKFHSMWRCRCKCGNEIIVANCSLVTGHVKSCGCCSHTSFEEDEIRKLCENISGYKFLSNRNILNSKEIDIYCKELKLGIEYNGSVFHATINGLYSDKSKYYHRDKFLLAKEKGIHLITLFDVDWIEKQDKIIQYFRDIFTPKIKIYARNCRVEIIDKKIAHEFCNKYHLQSHSNIDTIFYGLYCNDDLLSVMTFGVRRYSKKYDEYELYRYVTKSGYCVIGGASKILKRFEKDYTPKEVVSYSDNDYFSGNLYSNLGFKYDGQCSVSYYWVLNNKKLSREQCQLKKLKLAYKELYDESILNSAKNKEDYIMSKLGAMKIYRCGNTRWVKMYE